MTGSDYNQLLEQNTQINTLLKEQAERGLTTLHRPLEQVGILLARPVFIISALVVFSAWILLNLDLRFTTHHPWDEPPFIWLQGLIGLLSLVFTATVLVSQARQGQIAEQRSQLQLQLILLTEQRSAKVIALIEELRRDMPDVKNRRDLEAESMQEASEPEAILEALSVLDEGGPTSLPDDDQRTG